eukprot:g78321.t1
MSDPCTRATITDSPTGPNTPSKLTTPRHGTCSYDTDHDHLGAPRQRAHTYNIDHDHLDHSRAYSSNNVHSHHQLLTSDDRSCDLSTHSHHTFTIDTPVTVSAVSAGFVPPSPFSSPTFRLISGVAASATSMPCIKCGHVFPIPPLQPANDERPAGPMLNSSLLYSTLLYSNILY